MPSPRSLKMVGVHRVVPTSEEFLEALRVQRGCARTIEEKEDGRPMVARTVRRDDARTWYAWTRTHACQPNEDRDVRDVCGHPLYVCVSERETELILPDCC